MSSEHTQVVETILANLHVALERWYNGDPWGYAELYADEITFFDPFTTVPLTKSTQFREHYAGYVGAVAAERYEVIEPRVQLYHDVAVLSYNLKQFNAEGEFGPTWNATEVYHRFGEDWRVVHGHWSLWGALGD